MRAALAAAALAAGSAHGLSEEYTRANGPLLWANFKQTHHRTYAGAAEEAARYKNFMVNMVDAARLEKANPRATFGASKFADLTKEEFKQYHNLHARAGNRTLNRQQNMFSAAEVRAALSDSVDWRSKGAVTQVKDQGHCGSCWSFATTGGIEGAWQLAGNDLTSVSEQELVSCDKVDNGCNGGLMDNAYRWLLDNKDGKIVTEESYPYTAGSGSRGSCSSVTDKTVGATITGSKDLANDEDQMATWMQKNGPIPIAVDAQEHWQTYTGGVVSSCTGTSLDHGVMAVGYTSDYWIVKNSWGPSWGESGYIRLEFGSNQCGINKAPTVPEA